MAVIAVGHQAESSVLDSTLKEREAAARERLPLDKLFLRETGKIQSQVKLGNSQ
ncbi:MAG: hypothetical protein R3E08_00995 [Thiotrichaceae bacterium]